MINKIVVAVSASFIPIFLQMKKWKEELDKLHHKSY